MHDYEERNEEMVWKTGAGRGAGQGVVVMGYTHYWYRRAVLPLESWLRFVADVRRIYATAALLGIVLAGGSGAGRPQATRHAVSFNGQARCGHVARDLGITWPCAGARGFALAVGKEPTGDAVIAAKLRGIATRQQSGGVVSTTLCGNPFDWSLDDKDVGGTWFAGAQLRTRTCGGDCSHESCTIARVVAAEPRQRDADELLFSCCKTAYKPYDIVVTAVLVAARHHFGPSITVQSDGDIEDWRDGMALCHAACGYGNEFQLG